jgi:hypothetical protein
MTVVPLRLPISPTGRGIQLLSHDASFMSRRLYIIFGRKLVI